MQPNPSQPTVLNDGTTLDPKVLKVMKAIRQIESSGNYEAIGDGGASAGAFQWNNNKVPLKPGEIPARFKDHAREAGVQVADFSRGSQNKVAYAIMKKWKDEGLGPEEIAAKWNGAYRDEMGKYHYNKPEYGENFRKALMGDVGGNYVQPPAPKPFVPAQATGVETLQQQIGGENDTLLQDYAKDFERGGLKMNEAYEAQQNPLSKAYQIGGGAAGIVGDIVDTSIEHTPILGSLYKGAKEVVGGAVQGALNTAPGQALTEKYNELSPELRRNIEATGDYLSLIPSAKLGSTATRGFLDTKVAFTEGRVMKAAEEEIKSTLNKEDARQLSRAEGRGLDPVGVIVKNQAYTPDIVKQNGKFVYDSKQAAQSLQKEIDADELALQNLLESTIKQNVGINLNDVQKKVLNDILPKGKLNANATAIRREVTRFFNDLLQSGDRTYVSLQDLNEIKKQARDGINFGAKDPYGTIAKQVSRDMGHSILQQVEKEAKKVGIKNVREILDRQGQNIEAKDILDFLDGRPIKAGSKGEPGLISSIASTVPGVEGVTNYINRKYPGTPTSKLKARQPLARTGREGLRQAGVLAATTSQGQEEQRP